MNIQKSVAQRLLAIAALEQIVGSRIYRGRNTINQTLKPPHIIIWLLSKRRIYDHEGYSGLTEADLQISCFSHDLDQAENMADLVLKSLEAWPGESEEIDSVFLTDESEGFEQNTLIHHMPLEIKIAYHEGG